MEVLNHECPSCSANISFNPKTQRWDCEYCGASYGIEDFERYESEMQKKAKSTNADFSDKVDMDEYQCQNCGAKIVTDQNTTATSCVYCGSTAIIKGRLQGKFQPEKLIPFENIKEDAINTFYTFAKKKWFAPKNFYDKTNIEKVQGVYIPFWLYDCDTNGKINASAQRITSWTTGNYRYTKTDYFSVDRAGSMSFQRIPADGSTKFDDTIMDSIEPYNYEHLTDFSPSYLSGFLAEKYDVGEEESFNRVYDRAKTSTIQELKDSIVSYSSVQVTADNIQVQKNKSEYVLLPVWLLNIKYKDKMYQFAMNGQSGKMVGNVPISVGKLVWKSLMFETIFTVITAFLLSLLGG